MKFPAHSFVVLAFFAAFGGIVMADAGDAEVAAYDAILAATEPGQTIVELGDMRVPVPTVSPALTRLPPSTNSTFVPSGREPASQPLVSVASPVPAQCAA